MAAASAVDVAAASAVDAVSVSAAAATYQLPWSWPDAPKKSILVNILLNRKSILVKRHASIARRWEHLICVSAYLGDNKITKKSPKNQERIISRRLKKNVPAGPNVYLRICYFLK